MKRIISITVLGFVIVFIVVLALQERDSEERDADPIKKTEVKKRQNLKFSEQDKERFERLGVALKQVKRLPFGIKAAERERRSVGDTGSIVGIVSDEEGKPIKGCLITLVQEGEPFTSARRSDLSGKFFFDKIDTGVYRARIMCDDFRIEREGIKVEKDRITNLNIVAQKEDKISTATVLGNIIDFVNRRPVENAMVEFAGENERSSRIGTDDLGRFSINVRYPQSGRIIISKEGYIRKEINIEVTEKELVLNNIMLVAGRIRNDGNRYQGIGAALIENNGEFVVAQVFDGTPASTAGLKKNDRIVQINGMDVSSLRLDELIALIRGDERTNVVLTVRRSDSIQNLQIVRDIIEIK